MNVTVENLAPCRKLVRVEVATEAVETAFKEVAAEFHREVKLPGFRPGKAPRDMVARTYSKEIEAEVKRKLIGDTYKKALADQKLSVVGYPDIEEIQFERGKPLQFAATVETAPEFELPEYKGLAIKREVGGVNDADVERALTILRDQRATYTDVSRPVQDNDFVVVNYTATTDGKPLTEIAPTARGLTQQQNFWMHIKPGSFIQGFTEQLLGASAGEKRTVNVDFPADFVSQPLAGKKAVYEVEIVQVKEKHLPEVNDEFAKAFGAESAEKLRTGVVGDLENELEYKKRRDVRDQLIRGLMEKVQFDLPQSVVLNETRNVIYDIVRENQQRGVSKEVIDRQKDEIYAAANNSAKDRVKVSFLLNRIAEKEGIKVDQKELTQRILFLADQYQIRPEKFIKQLQDRNGFGEIHEQILAAKTLDFLEKNAQVEEVPRAVPQA